MKNNLKRTFLYFVSETEYFHTSKHSMDITTPSQKKNALYTCEMPQDLYDCAICYGKIHEQNNSKTKCGHYFCDTCLDAWLAINTTCPMCRTVIKNWSPQCPPSHNSVRDPSSRIDAIPESRREIVRSNIIKRYTLDQYFKASNDLINNHFTPDFSDINESSFAPVDFTQ